MGRATCCCLPESMRRPLLSSRVVQRPAQHLTVVALGLIATCFLIAAIPFPRAETNSLAAVLPKTQAGRFVDLYDVYGDHYAGEVASGDEWESDEPLGMSAHADTPADPDADTGEERVHSAKGVQQSLAALTRSEHGGGDMMTGVFEMHDKRQRVNKLKQRAKRVQGAQMLSHISMLPRMQPRMNILKADKIKKAKVAGGILQTRPSTTRASIWRQIRSIDSLT